MEMQGMENTPMEWGDGPQQLREPSTYQDGLGYMDFQRQEWKCPGCGTINSFETITCPECNTSAMAIIDKYKREQKGKLSQRRTGKRIGMKAGIKLLVVFGFVLATVFVGYFVAVMSPLLIYAGPVFFVFAVLFCLFHPKKKDKRKAAKETVAHLKSGLIELAALIEEQAGL